MQLNKSNDPTKFDMAFVLKITPIDIQNLLPASLQLSNTLVVNIDCLGRKFLFFHFSFTMNELGVVIWYRHTL